MIKKSQKVIFLGPTQIIPYFAKRSFLRHLENRLIDNPNGKWHRDRCRYHSVFCPFFSGRTDGYTRDRLKLQILNKKRLRCAPAQLTNVFHAEYVKFDVDGPDQRHFT